MGIMKLVVGSDDEMRQLGEKIGRLVEGGEFIELIGDVGAGKTTLTKGIALGLDITEPVQSPTFTISRVYEGRGGIELRHYDFYRLNEAGIMSDELSESIGIDDVVTVVEWAGVVDGVMPQDRLRVDIAADSEQTRTVELTGYGESSKRVLEGLQ